MAELLRYRHRMDLTPRQLVRNTIRLGSGEFLTRALSVAIVIVLGHLYGVVALGCMRWQLA